MKSIQLHIIGISRTFVELGKGKYVLFFIPGSLIALFFWQIFLISENLESSLGFFDKIPLIGSYISTGVEGTFSLIEFILNQLFIFSVLTVLSPFNTILGEKIDSELTGKKYPFDLIKIINDLIRMIFIVLIALILEFFFLGFYWIIALITGIHFLDDFIYFIIAAFFYGFSFYDYSLERDELGVFTSLNFAFSNILMISISGCIFLGIYNIPYIGVILAPVLTTMISTFVYIKNKPTSKKTIN